MKIALDVMGGDNAPKSNIDGAIEAIKELNVEIILVHDTEDIQLDHLLLSAYLLLFLNE